MTDTASPGQASRGATLGLLAAILLLLIWYLLADRLTPYSSQARVQAFVVPVAAEVAGQIKRVYVHDNQDVEAGAPLFEIDPEPYDIALAKARSDYQTVLSGVKANTEGVKAAEASLMAMRAAYDNAAKDAERQERLYREDPGAISVRRLEVAQASRETAKSQVAAAEADVRRTIEAAGASGDDNSQLLSARSAVHKAELDRQNTRVVAPGRGLITDLSTDAGQFIGAGAPAMTLIAILLDSLPGQLFEGKVRSVGYGVGDGKNQPAGTLPTVDNNRDWLRQAQRFPVKVAFKGDDFPPVEALRIGGQADVLVYTGESGVMHLLGTLYIRLMSLFSFLY
ncbi:HlyD family secretion protein [Aeromonas sp. MaB10011B]|uniref:HlyD family secretion protein n=1 Tax=Aeromonas TaxID=642 RepID=UPI001B31A86A|nr:MULTISPECIES: biotin/lipoyl-binding protein [Aeromonas]MBP4066871.1 HlyD family secretion protein [Aeromonas sp. MaB10011B]MBP4078362.1 HlyD family secretion protein [Aeromonas sp. MrichA-1]